MKKLSFFILCILFCSIIQGQTDLQSANDDAEITALRKEFQELSKNKDFAKAIVKGAMVSDILIETNRFKEAASMLYQMDQLVYESEKKTGRADSRLRFWASNKRLRLYTHEGRAESSKTQFNEMRNSFNYLKNDDSLMDDMLLAEAEYYHKFGMAAKGLESYKKMLQRCITNNEEQNREKCYKDMLAYAESNKIPALTSAVQKLYTAWQDSIQMVKAAGELKILQQEHEVLQQELLDKEKTISNNRIVTIGLWVFIIVLIAALVILVLLLLKSIYQIKKLKKSLKIANESNVQKSGFIDNINTQITPTLDIMENAIGGPSFEESIQESIVALKQRVTNMQTYISLEKTREEAYPVNNVDVQQLSEAIMQKASTEFKRGVEAVVTVPRVSIKTNTQALEEILSYLLHRAASNTESGRITLEFKKRNARTGQFIITDTGNILDSEKQETLFQPFAETDPLAQENGWGLPICQLMAYKLNGTITLDAGYEKGNRFILNLRS